jgi:sporulation protein YlmC with PRC-barrel domain
MKRLTSAVVALAFVALLPAAALAQAGTSSKTDRAKAPPREAWSNTEGLHETGDIIGAKVQNSEGKDIGKVGALLIDPKSGKVTHAVIGLGGFLGLGKDKVVVPYSDLTMSGHEAGRKATIKVDQALVEKAPKYVKATERSPSASPATTRSDRSAKPESTTDKSKSTTK